MASIIDHNMEYIIKVSKTSLIDKLKWTYRIWSGKEVEIKLKMRVKD